MKKILSVLLCILLLSPVLCCTAAAGIQDAYTLQKDGLSVYWVDKNGQQVVFNTQNADSSEIEDVGASLPTSYMSNNVTAVKDQSPTNACWTYSVLSVLESSYINRGFGKRNNTDFSEAHLTWFANNGRISDSTDPTSGDGTQLADPYDAGGSFLMAINALARGAGIATESRYPMDTSNPPAFTTDQMYVSDARMENAHFLTTKDEIKQAVMENGGVAVCFYIDNAGMKTSNTTYANDDMSYYSNSVTAVNHKISYSPNHAATIVGWDDSFAKTNYSTLATPAKAGAWLCKNSWGTDFGDNGYFWISYEDTTLRDYVTLTANKGNIYDSVAQYDGYGYNASISVGDSKAAYTANIFRANKKSSIRYAAFHTLQADLDYTVYIYRNVAFDSDNPTEGILALSVTGNAEYAGYHTVDLGKDVPIEANEYYSVVVEFPLEKSETLALPVEGRTITQNKITYYFDATENTSYVGYLDEGCAWIDAVEQGYNNTCVKACLVNGIKTAKTMQSPKTVIDRTTGIRLTYDAADFAAGATVSLQTTANTSAADFAKQQLSDKFAQVQTTGYTLRLTVNGKQVTTANAGFKIILPFADTSFSNLRAAQLTSTDAGQSLYYFPASEESGFITIQTDSLEGSFITAGYSARLDIESPSVQNNQSFLSSILSFFKRLIEFFRNIFQSLLG